MNMTDLLQRAGWDLAGPSITRIDVSPAGLQRSEWWLKSAKGRLMS